HEQGWAGYFLRLGAWLKKKDRSPYAASVMGLLGDSKEQQRNPDFCARGRDAFGVPAAVEAVFLDETRRWEHGFKGGT
ncbi:hypothetical protein BK138_35685, partial [Paenibacillus rhizosphaerae]